MRNRLYYDVLSYRQEQMLILMLRKHKPMFISNVFLPVFWVNSLWKMKETKDFRVLEKTNLMGRPVMACIFKNSKNVDGYFYAISISDKVYWAILINTRTPLVRTIVFQYR